MNTSDLSTEEKSVCNTNNIVDKAEEIALLYSVFNEVKEIEKLNSRSYLDKTMKLIEEKGELAEVYLAITKSAGSEYKQYTTEDLFEELVDVFLCYVSLCITLNVKEQEIILDNLEHDDSSVIQRVSYLLINSSCLFAVDTRFVFLILLSNLEFNYLQKLLVIKLTKWRTNVKRFLSLR
jgi:NTP pyrophosphatase (non-canonical NTP hydrolase)